MQRIIKHSKNFNQTTYIITSIFGTLLALAGFEHGMFAFLQGNKTTGGMFIQAIEKSHQRWKYGGEDAFTLIPNFRISGLLAMTLSLIIIFWILHNSKENFNSVIFLLLFIFLTLTGGGIGYIPFFVIIWAYSTRISKPLTWWKKLFKYKPAWLTKLWPFTVTLTVLSWLLAIEIAIFGYFPGITDPADLLNLTWLLLLTTLILLNLSYISGFAYDIKKQTTNRN